MQIFLTVGGRAEIWWLPQLPLYKSSHLYLYSVLHNAGGFKAVYSYKQETNRINDANFIKYESNSNFGVKHL